MLLPWCYLGFWAVWGGCWGDGAGGEANKPRGRCPKGDSSPPRAGSRACPPFFQGKVAFPQADPSRRPRPSHGRDGSEREGSAAGASPAAPSMGAIVLRGFAPALGSAAPFIWIGTHKYSLARGRRARPRLGQSPKSTGRGGEGAEPPLPGWGEFLESVGWHRDRAGTAGEVGGGPEKLLSRASSGSVKNAGQTLEVN